MRERCQHLASSVLRRLAEDYQQHYGYRVWIVERMWIPNGRVPASRPPIFSTLDKPLAASAMTLWSRRRRCMYTNLIAGGVSNWGCLRWNYVRSDNLVRCWIANSGPKPSLEMRHWATRCARRGWSGMRPCSPIPSARHQVGKGYFLGYKDQIPG